MRGARVIRSIACAPLRRGFASAATPSTAAAAAVVKPLPASAYHVVVLAAGVSRRMGDFAHNRPKSLLQLNGSTLIERQLSLFEKR